MMGQDDLVVCTKKDPISCLPFKESSGNLISNGLCLTLLEKTTDKVRANLGLTPCGGSNDQNVSISYCQNVVFYKGPVKI